MASQKLRRQMYVGQVRAVLPPGRIDPELVQQKLQLVQAAGLPPREVYQEALRGRPSSWAPAPLYEEVEPVPTESPLATSSG